MPVDRGFVLLYVVHVVLGAVLYLDVVRARRSGWWLIAFWALTVPAVLFYGVLRWQDWRTARAKTRR